MAKGLVAMIQAFQRLLRQSETPAAQLLALPIEELQTCAQQLEHLLHSPKQ